MKFTVYMRIDDGTKIDNEEGAININIDNDKGIIDIQKKHFYSYFQKTILTDKLMEGIENIIQDSYATMPHFVNVDTEIVRDPEYDYGDDKIVLVNYNNEIFQGLIYKYIGESNYYIIKLSDNGKKQEDLYKIHSKYIISNSNFQCNKYLEDLCKDNNLVYIPNDKNDIDALNAVSIIKNDCTYHYHDFKDKVFSNNRNEYIIKW